jgi:hypothetical protein
MNFTNPAPDIQEDRLFLFSIPQGSDPVTERDRRAIVALRDWGKQKKVWEGISEDYRRMDGSI